MKTSKFKMTEIGEIPADWEVKRLGNLMSFKNGYTADAKCYGKGGVFASVLDALSNVPATSENIRGRVAAPQKAIEDFSLKFGDLIFTRSSETLEDVGRANVYLDKNQSSMFGGFVIRGRPIADFDSVFLNYILRERSHRQRVIVKGAGAQHFNIGQIGLADVAVVMPPLAEQKAIAEALSDVDALIAAQEELIEKKRAIKQGAMQELLTGKKRLPGFGGKCRQERLETEDFNAEAQRRRGSECKMTEVGLIPVDWKVKRLGDVGSFSKGAGISRAQANSGKIPAVRYGELYTTHHNYIKRFESFISDEVAKESTQLTYGDIVFACSGETKEEIGKCAAVLGSEVAEAGGDLIILSPRTGYDSKFLAFELNAPYCALQKAAAGQGDAVVHIRRESLENLIVVVPSLAEQKAIAEVLSDMDAEISELEAQKAKFESIKQGMMQELLTGKIRLEV